MLQQCGKNGDGLDQLLSYGVLLLHCVVKQTCASLQLIMSFIGILTTVLKFVITFWVESLQMPKAVYCCAQLKRKKMPQSGWSGQDWLTQLDSGWRFLSTSRIELIWESVSEHPTCMRFDYSCHPSYSANSVRPAGVLAEGCACLTLHKAKMVFTFSS